MLAVFSSGAHNCSPKLAQSVAADSRDRLVSRMTPESADALFGPVWNNWSAEGRGRPGRYLTIEIIVD